MTSKKSLRSLYKKYRSLLKKEDKELWDGSICKAVFDSEGFALADDVLMFAPMPCEVDIFPIARRALKLGKRIYFPICNTTEHTMSFRQITSLDMLRPGDYGILTPPADSTAYEPSCGRQAICLVPGLVYDVRGYRIGYGKGYYDRFLPDFKGISMGIVYSQFLIPYVPNNIYDTKVHIIVTERSVTSPIED